MIEVLERFALEVGLSPQSLYERQVFVEVLSDGIEKGRSRGLKVHAWLFAMNFGKGYAQGTDYRGISRQAAAR